MDPDDQSNIPQNKYPIRVQVVGATGEQITSFGGSGGSSDSNLIQIKGVTVDTNSGNKSAGTQRFVLATDQPNLTSPLNSNIAQMNGITISMGNGTTDTGVQRVTISSDSTGVIKTGSSTATGSTVPANAFYLGINDLTTGNLVGVRAVSATTNTASGILGAGISAVFDDTSPTAITENNLGTLRMSANRNLYSTIRDAAGNERGVNVNASNQLSVSADAVTPGTAATNLGKAVDSVAGSTDTGVAALFVRRDAPVTLTPADGDYARAGLDSLGLQWVREYYGPVAEDNTNGVIGTIDKPVVASTYSGTASTSFGTATTAAAKAAPGVCLAAYASNENAAVRYLQIHNRTSVSSSDAPIFSFPIPAGSANTPGAIILDKTWFQNYYFSTGVSWAISTAKGTYTAATASEHTVNVQAF